MDKFFIQSFYGIDCKKMDLKTFMMDYLTALGSYSLKFEVRG